MIRSDERFSAMAPCVGWCRLSLRQPSRRAAKMSAAGHSLIFSTACPDC
jgi:hypothetical protein